MIRRTRIKMCGTTRLADAAKAVELGVDALGFIFVEKSPRYVVPESALKIIRVLPPFIFKIGVFVDAEILEVAETVQYLGLTACIHLPSFQWMEEYQQESAYISS